MASTDTRIRSLGIESRVEDTLGAAEFDAIVSVSIEGFQYLSGCWIPYARHYLTRPNVVVWPKDGQPALVVGADQVAAPRAYSWISDIRPFSGDTSSYAAGNDPPADGVVHVISDVIREMGVDHGRIGLELLHTPVPMFAELRHLLPDATFAGCDDFLIRLRATKTPAEVALIERCAHAGEQGLRAAIRSARAGWTEKQLAAEMRQQMFERGVDNVTLILLGAGPGAKGFLAPTERRIELGQLVRIDFNAVWGGYYCDIGRMAVVGEPSQPQEDIYRRQMLLNADIVEFMRPGIKASDVFERCLETAEQLGVTLLEQPSIGLGHATGINSNDPPKLNAGDSTILEPGMIFNIEPDVFGPEGEVVHVEEMVVVEPTGTRVITATEDWSTLPVVAVE